MSISFSIHNCKSIKAAAFNGRFGSSWVNLYITTEDHAADGPRREEITLYLDSYAVAVAYASAINNAPDTALAEMLNQREAAE